jgi:putative ABC transport system permease protein
MSIGQRIFRKLLKLFPAEFRGDFGDEMTAVFAEEHREAMTGGRRSVLALWMRTLHGIAATAPREHGDLVWNDLRYGLRVLARSPAFTAAAVMTLAIGIGATTAIFTLVNAVLFRPLPYADADRLVWVRGSFSGGDLARVSPPDFQDYRERSRSFAVLAAMFPFPYTLSGGGEAERVKGALVSADFFAALGVPPVTGRTFLPSDATEVDRATTVVISYGLWQRRFGGRADIVGQSLVVNGRTSIVVGVMPPSFGMPREADVWVPGTMRGADMEVRAAHFLIPIGRLNDGVTVRRRRPTLT